MQRDHLGEHRPGVTLELTASPTARSSPATPGAGRPRWSPDRSRPGRRPASAAAACPSRWGPGPGRRSRAQHLPQALAAPCSAGRRRCGRRPRRHIRRARPWGRRRRRRCRRPGRRRGRAGWRRRRGGPGPWRPPAGAAAPGRGGPRPGPVPQQLEVAADEGLGDADGQVGDRAVQLRQDRCLAGVQLGGGPPQLVQRLRPLPLAQRRGRRPRARRRHSGLLGGAGHGLGTSGVVRPRGAPAPSPRARPGARRRRRPPRAPGRPAGGRRRTGPRTGWCAGRRRCVRGGHRRRTGPAGRRCGGPQTTKSSPPLDAPRSGPAPRARGSRG